MDVSILITCYNLEKYIDEALNSLLAQDYKGFYEIIVIDDFSTDGSVKVIEKYVSDRVKLIKNPKNLGAVDSINLGFEYCKGKYICRFDGDDKWYSNYLSKVMAEFESNPNIDFIHSDMTIINQHSEIVNLKNNVSRPENCNKIDFEFDYLLREYYINAPTIIAKRDLWKKAMPWPNWSKEGLGDWFITLKMLQNNPSLFISEPLAYYRIHTTNMHRSMIVNGAAARNTSTILNYFGASNKIKASHNFELGKRTFGIGDTKSAKELFKKTVRFDKRYLLNFEMTKYYLGCLIGKSAYNRLKQLFNF